MAHKCQYEDRITEIDGDVWRIVNAQYKNMSLDVYKVNLTTNKVYAKDNLVFYGIGGYMVNFPNEKVRSSYYSGYTPYIEIDHEWKEYSSHFDGLEWGRKINDHDREIITKYLPQYKYLIKKIPENIMIAKLPHIFEIYNKYPQSESLLALGLYKLALNKTLYKMKKENIKPIIQYLNKYRDNLSAIEAHSLTLKDIKCALKNNVAPDEYYYWQNFSWGNKFTLEEYRYCVKKNIDGRFYKDMLNMAQTLGHNIEEDYWHYPNDPVAIHNRLMQQIDSVKAQKEKLKLEFFEKISLKNQKEEIDLGNGYTLFIPSKYEQVHSAAVELKQCLLSCDYISKVAKGNSILVMIWHDGKPSSTAEIDYNKNILQFYGNEANRNDCKPSEIEQAFLNEWLKTFKPKKLKEYLISV